jgi:hypothetical protein
MRIEYVSKLMGHASIKTTQVYAKIVNEELDKAMDVFNCKSNAISILQNIFIKHAVFLLSMFYAPKAGHC